VGRTCYGDLWPLQIYNETIMDLLNPSATNLAVREDIRKGVYVEGLLEEQCHSGACCLPACLSAWNSAHCGSTAQGGLGMI
jgi:hypothetical protein